MQWSYSASKNFHQCQRRWYFQSIMANSHPKAKDQLRREAFFLSQLQSIEAWRGSLVDWIIEKKIIAPLNQSKPISERHILKDAKRLYTKQLEFSRHSRFRENGMTKAKGDEKYAALFNHEYELEIDDEALQQAWRDIETALYNLFDDQELMKYLESAEYLLSQRTLRLKEDDFTITAKPDVIGFYKDAPPLIIDWKVQSQGNREYWLQLACYALALTQNEPHRDFKKYEPQQYSPADIQLAEVQLLLPETRWYTLTEDDIDFVENYIHCSANDMLITLGDEGNDVLRPLDFLTTQYPENCEICPFQKICGEYELWVS